MKIFEWRSTPILFSAKWHCITPCTGLGCEAHRHSTKDQAGPTLFKRGYSHRCLAVPSTVRKVYEKAHVLQHWFYFKIWGNKHAQHLFVLVCILKSNSTEENAKFTWFFNIKYKICLFTLGVFMAIFTNPWRNAFSSREDTGRKV